MDYSDQQAQHEVAPANPEAPALRSNPGLRWFSDKHGAIVVDWKTREIHVLSPRATVLLSLCDGTRTLPSVMSMANSLAGTKHSKEHAVSDRNWIVQSCRSGLIVQDTTSSGVLKMLSANKLRKVAQQLIETDQLNAARRCAKHLVRQFPKKCRHWYLLGDIEHAAGDYVAARRAYKKYLDLDPDNLTISHLVTALSDKPPPPKASVDYVRQTFDDYADTFDQSLLEDLGYRTPEVIVAALKKHMSVPRSQHRIADLGCGTGLMGKSMAPWAHSICGVDLSSQMMSKALLTGFYNEIHVAEITEWLHSDIRTFDLIVAADVLVYFGDLGELVQLAAQRMAHDALFAFTVEKSEKPGFDLTVTGRYAHHAEYIKSIAKQSGFEVLSLKTKTLRYEYGSKVAGLVVVCRKAADSSR